MVHITVTFWNNIYECPNLLTSHPVVLHDGAPSHIAAPVDTLFHRWNWAILEYLPYTPDVCVPVPTHCTIMRFGFHARWIDGVRCGLFSNHTLFGQTHYVWDEYLYSVLEKVEVRVTVSVTVCVA